MNKHITQPKEMTAKAIDFLQALQKANQVHLDDYLSKEQQEHLQQSYNMDHATMLRTISAIVCKSSQLTNILHDQSPQLISDEALKNHLKLRKQTTRANNSTKTSQLITVAMIIMIIGQFIHWTQSNTEETKSYSIPLQNKNVNIQTAYTSSGSNQFPSSQYDRLPLRTNILRHYIQFDDAPRPGLWQIKITAENGTRLGSFNYTSRTSDGYLYTNLTTKNIEEPTRLTTTITLNGNLVVTETKAIGPSWYQGFFGFLLPPLFIIFICWGFIRLICKRA